MLELNKIYNEDCLEGIKRLPNNFIDSIVTDPPYELGFMGKKWDSTGIAYNVELWQEALRVLKPGGHLLAFGGTRTYHRMACAIEDAGFEIRDCIQWIYGSGFPKSMDISKAIDKRAGKSKEDIQKLKDELRRVFALSGLTLDALNKKCGFEASGYLRKSSTWASILPSPEKWWKMRETVGCDDDFSFEFKAVEREVIGCGKSGKTAIWNQEGTMGEYDITAPTTPEAQQWEGWGTALKPANEPIVVARKPLEGTVADNVLKWGTGGINIDGCRIATDETISNHSRGVESAISKGKFGDSKAQETHQTEGQKQGRFPANVILDEEAGIMLDEQSGILKSGALKPYQENHQNASSYKMNRYKTFVQPANEGGASRFFYTAKASKKERGEGNNHPTVKPIMLMEYLIKLVTPINGITLDIFAGSGTSAIASINVGRCFIGFEKDKDYYNMAQKRIADFKAQASMFDII